MTDPAVPLVSVVTPVYNGVRFLGRATTSLAGQTFGGWEHLLVDDGSADGSWDMLEKYAAAEPRARLFRHTANRGPSAARNTALRQARGQWVAYLDCDDEFYPDYLQRLVDYQGRGDVLVFAYDLIEERPGHPDLGRAVTWTPGQVHDRLMTQHIAVPLGVVHRRALLGRVGLFDETLALDEDSDLWRRFARAGARFAYLAERSGRYHVRPDSAARLIHGGALPAIRPGAGAAAPPERDMVVELRLGEERFRLETPPQEVWVVRAVLEAHEYGGVPPHWLRQPPTVLDVGANLGSFAVYAKLFYHRRAVVHCFEPFPPTLERLRRNVASFADVVVHPFALGGRDGEATLYLHRELSGCHSLVRGLFDNPRGEVRVPVRNAGRVWDELGLEEVDVLKMDTEGSEVEILEALGDRLSRVRSVLAEFHRREDRRRIDALLPGFTLFGFKFHSVDVGVVKYGRADLVGR